MSTPLFSKLMQIQIDSSTIGCATDFSLKMSKDLIEVACLDASGAKSSVPDMYSWSVSGSGLVMRTIGFDSGKYGMFHIADNLLNSDASVAIAIVPDVSGNQYYSGVGYFSSLGMEGGVGAPVTYSFEITGSGPLSILTTTTGQ